MGENICKRYNREKINVYILKVVMWINEKNHQYVNKIYTEEQYQIWKDVQSTVIDKSTFKQGTIS